MSERLSSQEIRQLNESTDAMDPVPQFLQEIEDGVYDTFAAAAREVKVNPVVRSQHQANPAAWGRLIEWAAQN